MDAIVSSPFQSIHARYQSVAALTFIPTLKALLGNALVSAYLKSLKSSFACKVVDIISMYPKHPSHLRNRIAGAENILVFFLIFDRPVKALGRIPAFKALLGDTAFTQDFDNLKMPFAISS